MAREILEQADRELDFLAFDRDGDGYVDVVFLVLERTPARLLIGNATGVGHLGLAEDYVAMGSGRPVRVADGQGTVQQGRTFAEAVGSMAHEYGHVLGLPDLYNTAFLRTLEAPPSGRSWTRRDLEQSFERIAVEAHRPGSLYALAGRTLWHSEDHGRHWSPRLLPTVSPMIAIISSPRYRAAP